MVDEPVHVAHVAAPESSTVAYAHAGRGRPRQQSRLVETFAGADGAAYLVNAATEVHLDEAAQVDRYKLQREGADALRRDPRGASRRALPRPLQCRSGAALCNGRHRRRAPGGEGGECSLDGLFVLDGRRVGDTHSRVEHAAPRRQSYKGVLDGQSRGVFNGLVVVRPGAQKTDAWQMNKNLLLSRGALVHSTPQLKDLADDVKCKHGSTTGQLDPLALFYLRSRGIGEAEARSLLTWAFASDLLKSFAVRRCAPRSSATCSRASPAPRASEEAR
ncbi:MAG: SufD family Fe-S cluster assembly protein [Vicinamibacteria bacterium]